MSDPGYVVRITGKSSSGRTFNGTGFLVHRTGLIATCLHVAMPEEETPQELWAEFGLGRRWKCSLSGVNKAEDLAVIAVTVPIEEEISFAQLDADWRVTTRTGDEVSVWGCSAAEHFASPQKFTCHVSGFAGEYARIGLNGSINAGDSGAPVVNSKGLVIGVAQLRDRKREGQAMAIPVSYLIPLLPDPVLGNPYRGLEYFDVEHSGSFFGREALTERLLETLKPLPGRTENRFLGLVGPVGSGKSSLARAGLLAAIERGRLPGSERWPIAICRPGADPLENLAIALAKAHNSERTPAAVRARVQEFRASDRTLHLSALLSSTDLSTQRRVVVLVDQFEEIFTHCRDEEIRRAFIDNLLTAVNDPAGQTIVLLTLRADFYGECAGHPQLAAALSGHQALVGPMREEELRQSIESPALRAGAEFEHGLVDLLLDAVRGQPGSLPLLQYSLSELWQLRDGNRLTHAAYQTIGTVSGAVERTAETVYLQFSEPEQRTLRRILLRLVQSADGGKATRRRVCFEDLLPLQGDAEQVEKVVDRMADAPVRLLTIEDPPQFAVAATAGRSHRSWQVVDIAHEALIRSWKRLGQWLDEDREFQLWQKRLGASLAEWEQSSRHPDALLHGKLLVEAKAWVDARGGDLNRAEQEFITAGLAAEKERSEKEARFNRALRVLVSVLAFLFIAAAATAVYARHEARIANSLALAAASEDNIRDDPDLALMLAIHALSSSNTPEAEQSLYHAMRTMSGVGFPAPAEGSVVLGMAYSPARRLLATANSDNSISLWDVKKKASYGPAINVGTAVKNLSFLPGGQGLAIATTSGVKFITLTGSALSTELGLTDAAQVNAAEFSPAGDNLAIATQGTASPLAIWKYPNGPLRYLSGQTGPVSAVRFIPPGGKSLITASVGGTLIGWEPGSGQKIFTLEAKGDAGEPPLRQLISLAVSPDGRIAAAGDAAGSIHVWDLRSQDLTARLLHSKNAQVRGLAFSSDGGRLASASQDGSVKLWQVTGSKILERASITCGKPLAAEKTDREGCTALVFIDEHTLEVADRDGDIRQYETDPMNLLSQAKGLIDLKHFRTDSLERCKKYLRRAACTLP